MAKNISAESSLQDMMAEISAFTSGHSGSSSQLPGSYPYAYSRPLPSNENELRNLIQKMGMPKNGDELKKLHKAIKRIEQICRVRNMEQAMRTFADTAAMFAKAMLAANESSGRVADDSFELAHEFYKRTGTYVPSLKELEEARVAAGMNKTGDGN